MRKTAFPAQTRTHLSEGKEGKNDDSDLCIQTCSTGCGMSAPVAP